MTRGPSCYPGSVAIDGATVPHDIMQAPPMNVEEAHIERCVGMLADLFAAELRDRIHVPD